VLGVGAEVRVWSVDGQAATVAKLAKPIYDVLLLEPTPRSR